MVVGFHTLSSNDMCSICQENMDGDPDVVAHDGSHGERHPYHKECILEWMNVQATCPLCRVGLDRNFSTPWRARVIVEMKNVKNDIFKGSQKGFLLALTSVGILAGQLGLEGEFALERGQKAEQTFIALQVTGVSGLVLGSVVGGVGSAMLGLVTRRF